MLRGLRLDGVEYGRFCLRERPGQPWGLDFPAQETARFHFVAAGQCWLKMPERSETGSEADSGIENFGTCIRAHDGTAWHRLAAGDAVLLPRGAAHVIASAPDAATISFCRCSFEKVCEAVFETTVGDGESGGDGAPSQSSGETLLFSGSMRFNVDRLHPLLRMMPPLMTVTELGAHEPGIPELLRAMTRELALDRVGAGGILARLADVVAASLIRSWVERGCGNAKGWIAAARDPDIGRVLAAIHREPSADWSLERLAELMRASRSAFAERFTRVVGETPARYVAQVRMHQARQWLTRDRLRIGVVAQRLGYDSEASFSRAFKRVMGVPPSRVRGGEAEVGARMG
jgi:AraC-like DNA-binding protein